MADEDHLTAVVQVVSAYVSNNNVTTTALPDLIATVSQSLKVLETNEQTGEKQPAVDPKKAVRRESIACLECGLRFKALKRHLGAAHQLTPDEYRAKWNLRADYPVVAPDYAETRSDLAKQLGLGRKPQESKPSRKRSR